MSFSDDIIYGGQPSIEKFLREGNSLDDLDEYGFTPLIECVIAKNIELQSSLFCRALM